MLLSNIFQTPKVWVTEKSPEDQYSFTDDTTHVFVPQKLQYSVGIQEFLTITLFTDTTKITNLGSKHHNLFLEWRTYIIVMFGKPNLNSYHT